jgi:site-specific recombinase XerD
LSAFYGWLQKEEILLKNPMLKIDVIKANKQPKKAFDEIDIERLRSSCRCTREKFLIELLLSTWCRVSEVSQIRLDEIKDDTILVHGKGEKDRIVYLNAKCKFALENYLAERKDSNPYLFPRAKYAGAVEKMAKGKKRARECEWYKDPELVDETEHAGFDTIEVWIRKIGKRAGVKNTHPHRFRRTGATYALRSGMPLMTVSKLLGHSGIGVTQVYLDISDAELEEAHKKYVK